MAHSIVHFLKIWIFSQVNWAEYVDHKIHIASVLTHRLWIQGVCTQQENFTLPPEFQTNALTVSTEILESLALMILFVLLIEWETPSSLKS